MKKMIRLHLTCGILALSPLLLGAIEATAQSTIKLYPYDADLARQINTQLEGSGILVAENPARDANFMATLRWDTTVRTAFTRPGDELATKTEMRDVPYETKPHRMTAMKRDKAEDESIQGEEKKPGLFSRLFGGDRQKEPNETVQMSKAESKEKKPLFGLFGGGSRSESRNRYKSTADPYDTKKHRRSSSGENKSFVENLTQEKSRTRTSTAEPVSVSPKMSRVELESESVEVQVEEPAVEFVQEAEPEQEMMVSNAQSSRTASPSDHREPVNRNFFQSVSDTITKPFTGWGDAEKSYTSTATVVFRNGRRMNLPDVKSRDEQELEQMMTTLIAQTAQWIHEGKQNHIPALNTAAAFRNPEDLQERIQRANEDPDWLRRYPEEDKKR